MHTYKKIKDNQWSVGSYVPVRWFNPIFGPRTVDEWETLSIVSSENEAQELVAKLNGGHVEAS